MSQIILVTSPNYTGKTTATANIGAGLARSGKKVLMIDMDTEYGKTRLDQILVVNRKYVNLCLMTIQQHEDNHLISQNQICRICDEWRKNFDYIIICACANGYGWRQALISSVDLTLIVTYPELACLREADKIIYNLAPANNERIKVLINFMGLSTEEVSPEDVRECLGTEYIGLIPYDPKIDKTPKPFEPVFSIKDAYRRIRGQFFSTKPCKSVEPVVSIEDSPVGQAYRNVVRRLCGENVPFML